MPTGALVYNKQEKIVVPNTHIKTWHDSGLRLQTPKGVHPRPAGTKVTQIVLHWTSSEREGEAGAKRFVESMNSRKDAGAHILITNEGIVWQLADLTAELTSHASHRAVKPQSIGIEVSNYGWLKRGRKVPSRGAGRERYRALTNGWRPTMANFYPAQQEAINHICWAMCEVLDIPKEVMLSPFAVRSSRELRDFEGVLGHCHCATGKNPKSDPGTKPLIAVSEYFKNN
jgi:N-acetyl-anhydromuramyl-L-alanine amidase AmpD